MNNAILKDYEKTFNNILKNIKKELKIKEKLGMSVTLCNNNHIHELNKTYRNKDIPTDVLSFAIEDNEDEQFIEEMKRLSSVREIGDIIISYEKAMAQAIEYGHSIEREMSFLFTHGVLHLLGYDHMNKTDEEIMFGLQDKVLNDMKINR